MAPLTARNPSRSGNESIELSITCEPLAGMKLLPGKPTSSCSVTPATKLKSVLVFGTLVGTASMTPQVKFESGFAPSKYW